MDNQQIFRAPLIPERKKIGKKKISKTTISSSVFTGALKEQIKLNKSVFSFIKPVQSLADPAKLVPISQETQETQAVAEGQQLLQKQKDLASDFENRVAEEKKKIFTLFQNLKEKVTLKKTPFNFLKPSQEQGEDEKLTAKKVGERSLISDELSETNKILVDIQKQLELDYRSRIDEEKQILAAEKKKISRQKVEEKEGRIEKGGRGILGKTFEKVTAPFKSIFQKLIDFFSIILTGILLNTAFKWLEKEENRKKLKDFFNFIGEYWQELLIIFAAYKLAKLVGVVVGVALKIKKIVNWFKKLGGPKPPKAPKGPSGGAPSLKPKPLGRLNASYDRFIAGKSNIGDRLRLLRRGRIGVRGLFTKGGFNESGQLKGQHLKLPKFKLPELKLPKITSLKPSGGLKLGAGRNIALILAELFKPQLQSMVGDLANNMGSGHANLSDQDLKKQYKESYSEYSQYNKRQSELPFGGSPVSIDEWDFGRLKLLQNEVSKRKLKLSKGGTIPKFSLGGTVGKGDRPGIDTTPAQTKGGGKVLLNEGEEVIRTSSSMLFRPLLKDINDNAGRMWQAFSEGIKKQDANNAEQFRLSKLFGDVITNFKDYVDEEIKKRKGVGTSGDTPTPTEPTSPTPPPAAAPPSASPSPTSTPPSAAAPAAPESGSKESAPSVQPTDTSQSSSLTPASTKTDAMNEGDKTNIKPKETSDAERTLKLSTPPPAEKPASETSQEPKTAPPISPVVDEKTKNMEIWKKSNPLLAAVAAERERTRGTRETTNPLMEGVFGKEYVGKLPSPAQTSPFVDVFSKSKPSSDKFNKISQDAFDGGGKTTVINLPPKVTQLPPKKQKSGQTSKTSATSVPYVSAVDYSNSYNATTLQYIGAVGYGNLYSSGIEALT